MNLRHGHQRRGATTKTYRAWREMLQRCERPTHKNYARYGGRGIEVCAAWHWFDNFLADMCEAPVDRTLGRIDNDGPYSRENCRWETRREQAANTRRNVIVTHNGQSMCVAAWARALRVDVKTLTSRLKKWGIDRALTQ